jgi:hypothetical protein
VSSKSLYIRSEEHSLSECESWVIFGVLSLVLEHTHPKLHFGFCTYYKCSYGGCQCASL